MAFTPNNGYSDKRASTVFSDGENNQRADFTYILDSNWTTEKFSEDQSSLVFTNGENKQRATVVYNIGNSSGGGSGADNNGLEGDYCSKYGIVDETASGLPTQGTGNQIIIPAQLVMDVPGVSGLTTNASAITHDLVSTTNCEIFLSEGTVIEATDVFFQTDEPDNGATGYAA